MKKKKYQKARDLLESVEKLDKMITNKLIERQQWLDLAHRITAQTDGERVQSSGSQQKMADAVNNCLDAEQEALSRVQELRARKREIVQLIERVDSPVEYDLLHRKYIQYQTLEEIEYHYNRNPGWGSTTHGRALEKVQSIIDGKKEHEKDWK